MPLAPGTRLGPYQIDALLGAGGMGEVYRAHDSRLDRVVAVKVVSASVAGDAEFQTRLAREARVVSQLNHPHICVLHDVGREGSIHFLVMELLDGETLHARLQRGPIPLHEALEYAVQIADALDTVHRHGVVHRDLKPSNIMLVRATPPTAGGRTVKLLDFGLAKPAALVAGADSMTPTRAMPITSAGAFVGTLHYMAPEQIEGKSADARTDVFAFGVVVYEMITGRSAFDADSVARVMTAILRDQPAPMSSIEPSASAVDWVIDRCLQKDPDNRWQSMSDVSAVLRRIATGAPAPVDSAQSRSNRSRAMMALAASAAAATVFAAGYALRGRGVGTSDASSQPLRLSVVAPSGTTFTSRDVSAAPQFALSPDGRRLVFLAGAPGEQARLWVRALDSPAAVPIVGTEDAFGPFWAPDSRTIAYFAPGKLRTISIDGGQPRDIADVVSEITGGDWNADGIIVFGGATGDGLFRVSANGGAVEPATRLEATRAEVGHRWPQFLPDGRRFIFFSRTTSRASTGVYLGSLDSSTTAPLFSSLSRAVFAAPHFLLFAQKGALMAQPFDIREGKPRGTAVALVDPAVELLGPGLLTVSPARNGTIAYWAGDRPPSELAWFDRSGRLLSKLGTAKRYVNPRISSDGRFVTVSEGSSNIRDVWMFNVSSGVESRLTFTNTLGAFGLLAGDSEALAYSTTERGMFELRSKPLGDSGEETTLKGLSGHFAMFPEDWSRDKRWLIYSATGRTAWDVWALDLGAQAAKPVVATPSNEVMRRLSPDGRWLAYVSDDSGVWQVYVTSFPDGRGKWQVSAGGGSQPHWRGDGKELFYIAPDGQLIAVSVVGQRTFEVGGRETLFKTDILELLAPYRASYSASPDGQRFLVNTFVRDATPQTITVVLNWQKGLATP